MTFLEFADPSRFWWGLLAIPIIVMFILRVRLRRRKVATLLLWDQLFDQQPPRAWWRRLRNLLALLCQLAFLALLVGALVDPLWSWQRREARKIVLIVDNSASMSATDDGKSGTRLERAGQSAKRMIASLRQHDSAAIVTAGGMPAVATGITGDVRILEDGIDRIKANDQPTRLGDAVRLARRLVADDERREIILLTDGADEAVETLNLEDDVTLYGSATETSNLAITAFQVRRSFADATSFQVLVEVSNFAASSNQCRLELELDGNLVDVIPLSLQPEQIWRQTLNHTSTDGGLLMAKLDVSDALQTDNQAIAVLPTRDPIPVLLISPGSLFLRSVLESIPGVELSIADRVPGEFPPETITVLHKTPLENIPNEGSFIIVDPVANSDLWKLGPSLPQPIVASQATDSPLMAHIRLQNVILNGAKKLEFSSEVTPLLQGPDDSPMYARIRRSSGDVLVLSVDLDAGDLPLRIAFPVMIKNAIESFLGGKGELRPAISAGQTTMIELAGLPLGRSEDDEKIGSNREDYVVRSPDGAIETISAADRSVQIGPFDQIGLWLVGPREELAPRSAEESNEGDSEAGRVIGEYVIPIAVNLADPDESDLRPQFELPVPPRSSIAWGGHSLWFYLSLLGLLGISVEWILYQRRMIG